jgi:hypothetical protein
MKNILITILGVGILAAVLEQFFPWWTIAIAGFALGYLVKQGAGYAFLAGFAAIFLLWTVYAYMLSHGNHDILASKVAQLLPMKGHVKVLLLVTGVIGGLVGGFSTLTGNFAAKLPAN